MFKNLETKKDTHTADSQKVMMADGRLSLGQDYASTELYMEVAAQDTGFYII
jgi:hypothetical protein